MTLVQAKGGRVSSTDLKSILSKELPLGFGVTAALTGPLAGGARLIETAIEHGVRVFDTAPSYGAGKAERLLAGHKDIFVMTKAGVLTAGMGRRVRDFSPAAIEQSIDASRGRLQRDCIDLVWLHGPDPDETIEPLFAKLEELKSRGWVRHFGIAGRGPKLARTMDHPIFEAVMCPVHAGIDEVETANLTAARAAGKFIAGIEVLAAAPKAGKGLSPGALRRGARALLRGRTGASGASGASMSIANALRWPIETGSADMVISSTTRRSRLIENVQVMTSLTEV